MQVKGLQEAAFIMTMQFSLGSRVLSGIKPPFLNLWYMDPKHIPFTLGGNNSSGLHLEDRKASPWKVGASEVRIGACGTHDEDCLEKRHTEAVWPEQH